jgi:hypothetical protein
MGKRQMPNTDELGGRTAGGEAGSRAKRRRPRSAGACQMAVTAIDHDGRVVTVTSQPVEIAFPNTTPPSMLFATSIYGGPLDASSWQATSWTASLRNHAVAVNQVIEAIASDVDRVDQQGVVVKEP